MTRERQTSEVVQYVARALDPEGKKSAEFIRRRSSNSAREQHHKDVTAWLGEFSNIEACMEAYIKLSDDDFIHVPDISKHFGVSTDKGWKILRRLAGALKPEEIGNPVTLHQWVMATNGEIEVPEEVRARLDVSSELVDELYTVARARALKSKSKK